MTHVPRTKIVGTLGPASRSREVLRSLIEAGLNVARINFSHGTHEQHEETVRLVREVASELNRPVAILGDLQGPRIRIGDLAETLDLKPGQDLVLVPEQYAKGDEIPVTYDELSNDCHVGDRILINDGLIELVVIENRPPRVTARVVHGGELKRHKGMNLPGINVSAPSITDKDRADVEFAIKHDLDYIALSFVRKAEDIAILRWLLPKHIGVVAKIEKDVALENIESIIKSSDGVMVARGDLGVELPFEQVPLAQKRIISLSQRMGKPVITATQMLESMIEHPRPTRAEASDVANAILDGTDAVMLSAETAAGAYPRLAVEAMRRIITEVEKSPVAPSRGRDERRLGTVDTVSTEQGIAAATVAVVRMLNSPVVVTFTKSGFTARVVASHRPGVPILALTDEIRTYRQLALVWGVIPELVPPQADSDEAMTRLGVEAVHRLGLAKPGDRIILTAGVPIGVAGTTNLLKVETV